MLLHGVRWFSVVFGAAIYCAVFIFVRHDLLTDNNNPSHTQLGLLLFIAPGMVAAFIAPRAPLSVALLAALIATPFCVLVTWLVYACVDSFWQEMAWNSSAIFWSGLGALVVMFWRAMTPSGRLP
ncbi:hypothetical protein PMPD1_1609 [Paramixta manurensis]|uniref:Inner membrane protein n=1 Tax=Paramixta manurensis TaxID=2740817 RepID=A0A6M8UFQ8_9GAMM|nr:hypothetical protein PMPD1_1609 [Erwiniaceae bacterium PD-1]